MSTLAKAFVVITVILSIAYAAVSTTLFSQQKYWRTEYTTASAGFKSEMATKAKDVEDLKARISNMSLDIARLESDVKDGKTEIQMKNGLLTERETDIARLIGDNKAFQLTLGNIAAEIKALTTQNTELNGQVQKKNEQIAELEQHKDQLTQEKVRLDDQVAGLGKSISAAQRDIEVIRDQLSRTADELQAYKATFGQLATTGGPGVTPKAIRGRVLTVDPARTPQDDPIIVISVGKKDGVEVGYAFVVYRGSTYVGKVTVIKVIDDLAAARPEKKFMRLAVQAGDEIATKLTFAE